MLLLLFRKCMHSSYIVYVQETPIANDSHSIAKSGAMNHLPRVCVWSPRTKLLVLFSFNESNGDGLRNMYEWCVCNRIRNTDFRDEHRTGNPAKKRGAANVQEHPLDNDVSPMILAICRKAYIKSIRIYQETQILGMSEIIFGIKDNRMWNDRPINYADQLLAIVLVPQRIIFCFYDFFLFLCQSDIIFALQFWFRFKRIFYTYTF